MIKDYIDSKFSIDYLSNFDFVVTLGVYSKDINSDICINPLFDKNTKLYIGYEAGTEEGISALFLHDFCKSIELRDYINMLDYGHLTSETNISEEEMQDLKRSFTEHQKSLLLIGSNFYTHSRSYNILNMFSCLTESMNIAFLSINADEIYTIKHKIKDIEPIDNLPENNGCMVYIDSMLYAQPALYFSSEFAKAWKVNNGDIVEVSFDGFKIQVNAILDSSLRGVIGVIGLDKEIDVGYRYKQVLITK